MKYLNLKTTWQQARKVSVRAYFASLPIYWWILLIIWTFGSFTLDIGWFFALIISYFVIILDTIFYPWFRLFVATFPGLRKVFPYRTKGYFFQVIKNSCIDAIAAYRETGYDYTFYLRSDGRIDVETSTDSKRREVAYTIVTYIVRYVVIPIYKFCFLNFLGLFSFVLGWIYVPWCYNHLAID